jgi:AhpD family alkylhydroperoxidase
MYAGMANLPGVLETYLDGYGRFRNDSGFNSVEQEVVFLTISRNNGCGYCMAAHSMLADMKSGVPAEVTDAIRENRAIPDPKLAALSTFTDVMVTKRGLPSKADVSAFLDAGYEEKHILGIILAISVKTLSNYSNHLFHTPVDEMFAGRKWKEAA